MPDLKSKPEPKKIAVIGGGLAGCLTAQALVYLYRNSKNVEISLYDKASELCGTHTWCFHDSDVPTNQKEWLLPLISKSWGQYRVHFPAHSKLLNLKYLCIRSADLRQKTDALSQQGLINTNLNTEVKVLSPDCIEYNSKTYKFDYVIDCRGWNTLKTINKTDGFQKFIGLELELESAHKLQEAIVMDARVEQIDGYRFLYVLPFSENTLLVEDTYYSNSPELNNDVIKQRIHQYCANNNWIIKKIHYQEKGSLLIPSKSAKSFNTHICLGVQAHQYQPVTGYSTPYILSDLDLLLTAIKNNESSELILNKLNIKRYSQKQKTYFYILLNKMLFGAAKPKERYKILQRFYTFDEKLVQRFNAGQTSLFDMLRILSGRPPVSVWRAVLSLIGYKTI